jgi:tetratricopeptide (TPR) repeat protein
VPVRRSAGLNPKDFNAFNSRGKAYVAKGDRSRDSAHAHFNAIADFTRAIQLNPSYVEAYSNRGLSYETMGRRAEAVADFQREICLSGSMSGMRKRSHG